MKKIEKKPIKEIIEDYKRAAREQATIELKKKNSEIAEIFSK